MDEKMDMGFAVFNGHINKADKRARLVMKKRCPTYLREVQQIEREGGGIMAIFQRNMTRATQRYAKLVEQFVNENRR